MTARDWLEKAQIEGWALGAFNIDNLEIFKAVIAAAGSKQAPVIVEFSPGEVSYFGLKNISTLVENAREESGLPIFLNLDHTKSYQECTAAAAAGFDLIHFDGSAIDYEENVAIAKRVVELARACSLLVEGEIDPIAGSSNVHKENLSAGEVLEGFTNPDRALAFVHSTNVDIFAAFFGNVHGVFPNQPSLDLNLLKKIKDELPKTFLSMHGGSGIPENQVREAIKIGRIVKINVNTELRQAFRDTLEKVWQADKDEYAVYKYIPGVIGAVQRVVEDKIELFGSVNKA